MIHFNDDEKIYDVDISSSNSSSSRNKDDGIRALVTSQRKKKEETKKKKKNQRRRNPTGTSRITIPLPHSSQSITTLLTTTTAAATAATTQPTRRKQRRQRRNGLELLPCWSLSSLFVSFLLGWLLSVSLPSLITTTSTPAATASSQSNTFFLVDGFVPSSLSSSSSSSASSSSSLSLKTSSRKFFSTPKTRIRIRKERSSSSVVDQPTSDTTTTTSTTKKRTITNTILSSSILFPFGIVNGIYTRLHRIGIHMILKFQAHPITYLLIPVIAALVGWITNWLAVQMIFYPIEYRGLNIYRINSELPLGIFGWQGIIPCKTKRMTISMIDMVENELLSIDDAFQRLNPKKLATLFLPSIPALVQQVLQDIPSLSWLVVSNNTTTTTTTSTTDESNQSSSLSSSLSPMISNVIQTLSRWSKPTTTYYSTQFLIQFIQTLQKHPKQIFQLQNCVVNQMLQDRSKLGTLFRQCGQKELDFLVNSGLFFGLLLGCIQMAVALIWDNPWSLSIGGGIVGLATNWLALKWIFQPVDPIRIGIGRFSMTFQGKFLKRQPEVSSTFSKYFATEILTSDKIWNSILTDPETKPIVQELLANEIQLYLNTNFTPSVPGIVIGGGGSGNKWKKKEFPFLSRKEIDMIAQQVMVYLPKYVPVLYPYMDEALGLEDTLRVKMEAMTSRRFERVLHPIFEEDELTLILAGAGLGFGAGLVQQGLETGHLVLPVLPRVPQRFGIYQKRFETYQTSTRTWMTQWVSKVRNGLS